jgi:uncharacterized OB-fold protein
MSEEDRTQLPSPGWTPVSVGYWTAAHDGKLVVQRCSNCGNDRWPPSWACYHCQSSEWTWVPVPGTGTVYTYTWADQRALMTSPIYNVSVVELDGTQGEPVRMITQVLDVEREDLVVDLPVTVVFEPFDDEVAVPFFKAAGS